MHQRIAQFADLDPTTLYQLLRLRSDVFIVEQGSPCLEIDGRDLEPTTTHLWYDHDAAPIAYLRIVREPDGEAKIGRVVTAKEHRGAGHAGRLLARAMELIGPATPCVLDAQSHLAGFYGRFGFRQVSAEYVDHGVPHITMRREPERNGARP